MSRLRNFKWTGGRIAIAVAVVLVGYYVFAAVFASSGPKGEGSASYATVPDGVSAWAELLEKRGHVVTQGRESLETEPPDPGSTVILVDGSPLREEETDAVERFVRDGGRLILAEIGRAHV